MLSHSRGGRGGGGFIGVLLALAIVAAPAQAAFPDLVVTGGEVSGPVNHYAFAESPTRFVWWDSTKNIGAAPAPASNTRLFFSEKLANGGAGGVNWSPGWREVRALKPGASNKGSAESQQGTVQLEHIGTYFSFECANRPRRFRESDFDNNCRNLRQRFSVVPRRWEGTVNGTGVPYDGITEKWSADVTFGFDRQASPDSSEFVYKVRVASVQYSVSGTDTDGCTVSGSSPNFLILNKGENEGHSFRLFNSTDNVHVGQYSGFGVLPSGLHYTVSHTCPDPSNSWTENGPLGLDYNWFHTAGLRKLPSIIGFTHLQGIRSIPGVPIIWKWTLDAQ